MTPRQQRLIEALPRRALSARTQDASGRAVRPLAEPSHPSPARLTAAALRDSFLSLQHVKPSSRRASTLALCGIPCVSEPTRTRAWSPLPLVRAPREQQLPVLLRVAEGRPLRAPLKLLRSRAGRTTLSACGLRLHEGTPRPVPDLDRARRLVPGRHGTGAKDRSVPRPPRPLAFLRQDWHTPRPPPWLCPAPGRGGLGLSTASTPMPRPRGPEACRAARTPSGLTTRAAGHPLRPR